MRSREKSGGLRGLPRLSDLGIDLRSILYSENPLTVHSGEDRSQRPNIIAMGEQFIF